MDDPGAFFARPVSGALRTALADTPVICVLGPRQSGKTTLVRMLEPRYAYVSLDEAATLAFAKSDPTGFVAALPDPVVLDEVQRAPELLRSLKLVVDQDRRPGRYVLTGSANLLMLPALGDSLAGRMEIVQLHPLTAAEQARQPGALLAMLLSGSLQPAVAAAVSAPAGVVGAELAAQVVAGGFPPAIARQPARARAWHRQYLQSLVERDVPEVAQVRDARQVGRLLELLALRTAELLNVSTLANELDLRRETIEHYLTVCERLFLVRRLQPWHRHESKRLIKTPKLHLIDSGLAATLAGMDAQDWTARRERFGHLLESWVIQQLIAQAGWTDPDLRFWHYRDKDQIEVDLVITRGTRTWGVEIKSSATVNPSDGRGLHRLAEQCGEDFQGGMLLHSGDSAVPLAIRNCHAVPINKLWKV